METEIQCLFCEAEIEKQYKNNNMNKTKLSVISQYKLLSLYEVFSFNLYKNYTS